MCEQHQSCSAIFCFGAAQLPANRILLQNLSLCPWGRESLPHSSPQELLIPSNFFLEILRGDETKQSDPTKVKEKELSVLLNFFLKVVIFVFIKTSMWERKVPSKKRVRNEIRAFLFYKEVQCRKGISTYSEDSFVACDNRAPVLPFSLFLKLFVSCCSPPFFSSFFLKQFVPLFCWDWRSQQNLIDTYAILFSRERENGWKKNTGAGATVVALFFLLMSFFFFTSDNPLTVRLSSVAC